VFAVHTRAFFARHPRTHRALVGVLAIAAGVVVATRTMAADAARDAWGERRIVWAADHDTSAGAAVTARSVEVPIGLVPAAALDTAPSGVVARHHLDAGEILTASDVASADELLGDDRRGVAVAADDTTLPVSVGDAVDVVALGRVIATEGVVTEVFPTVVVVAVDAGVAAEVASAVLDRTASLVRAGG
jgi:hypothetical protein